MDKYILFYSEETPIDDPALTYLWHINIVVDIPKAHIKGLKRQHHPLLFLEIKPCMWYAINMLCEWKFCPSDVSSNEIYFIFWYYHLVNLNANKILALGLLCHSSS
jgi:hypothetical protein